MNTIDRMKLMELIEKYPKIGERIQSIFNITENASGKFDIADDAEEQVIIEMRNLGKEILQCWAENGAQRKTEETFEACQVTKHSKKNFTGKERMER